MAEVAEEEKKEEEATEEPAEPEEPAPKAELTEEEMKTKFRKTTLPDMSAAVLNKTFAKFSIPAEDEGFDAIKFEWSPAPKSAEHLKGWISAKKQSTTIDDLKPSAWFTEKLTKYKKLEQSWKMKQNQWKASSGKKPVVAAVKAKKPDEAAKEEEKKEEPEVDPFSDEFDIMGCEDILDASRRGQPLFAKFELEDWALVTARVELTLLVHAFKKDVDDPERTGIIKDHFNFYYEKYYKKKINTKFFGCPELSDLVALLKDAVSINAKTQVLEAKLPEEVEPFEAFVKLAEEDRRQRERRLDAGDETAKLKFNKALAASAPIAAPGPAPGLKRKADGTPLMQPAAKVGKFAGGVTAVRPVAGVRPAAVRPAAVRPAAVRPLGVRPAGTVRPVGAVRPAVATASVSAALRAAQARPAARPGARPTSALAARPAGVRPVGPAGYSVRPGITPRPATTFAAARPGLRPGLAAPRPVGYTPARPGGPTPPRTPVPQSVWAARAQTPRPVVARPATAWGARPAGKGRWW
eukprot:gnl/TRDRNA2_/TRDRNA2_161006_c0_seq1.p1 gnl/TRDRNA2_/TRDRNA2_161006_c0~~gnl/TRDRNA2_/TRDRNA2_161006_c0_seq1.p1  ORF type:complete len:556 (+),score=160.93 gnl/TRDRNA2_/TRDRNA2_161006_c0_seq1:102-1670(+)